MIPESHQKIAVERYGYDLTPDVRRTYAKHKRMCERLALALGYDKPFLDVPEGKVCVVREGTLHVLADDEDPMNLWCSAWSRLGCSLYEPPDYEDPGKFVRWRLWVLGLFRWLFT